ncbi:MAG: hypothetical protein IMF11_19890 [Proteobacteria bacterium]|nr:hypothetical protein [Pseudomonadota bacterium]
MRTRRRPPMNRKQKIVVVVTDILVLAELFFSIMQAKSNPEYMTPIFFQNFIPLVVITLLLARILVKRFRTESIEARAKPGSISPK